MQLPKIRSSKKERKQYADQNPFELIADGIKTSVVDELGKASINEAWDELLSTEASKSEKHEEHASPHHGDLSEGAELDLAHVSEQAHEIVEGLTEAGEEYIREIKHAGEIGDAKSSQEIQVKMQQILIEIKQLSNSSAELKKQVQVISMEQTGEDVGVYHLNYLEQMLSFIHDMRMNVEDSLAWFGALRSKKAARQYGNMAKQHGTSFTLSNERQVSTQVG